MPNKKILIIGEVFVDQHLDIQHGGKNIVRLGGIFHAIRACSAFNIDYAFAYYAPEYLEQDIEIYSKKLNSMAIYKLGLINRAPNVFLIGESDESGNQLYENILCEQASYVKCTEVVDAIKSYQPTDIIVFPGRYDIKDILAKLSGFNGKLHIDLNYDSEYILDFDFKNVFTVILSTSSITFEKYFKNNDYSELIDLFRNKNICHLLIKENRGGSWLYNYNEKKIIEAPAYIDNVVHSVGVGDVYDIAFIFDKYPSEFGKNMRLAAWASVIYAKTILFDSFKNNINLLLNNADEQVEMNGIRTPWNSRKKHNIYMAAPDFDYIDRKKLNELVDSLRYHNFVPRLPIRENGQNSDNAKPHEERSIFAKDLELLESCDLMIASLLYNDQGTLVEIGMFNAMKKPIIVYDPTRILNNLFLKYSCDYYCQRKSEVINAVFEIICKLEGLYE